jgi:signal transduction histidine kinase
MSRPVTVADLRRVDLFDDLDDDQLAEWAAVADLSELQTGDALSEQGSTPRGLLCLLEGSAQASMTVGGRIEPSGRQEGPTWIGAVPALTEEPVPVTLRMLTPGTLVVVPADEFRRLALAHPAVHRRIMRAVSPLMNRLAGLEQNRERMESLGKMAAGLAHELNNPAAAAQRSAEQLADALQVISRTLAAFVESGVERAEAEGLVGLQREALARASERGALDALDVADVEEDLLERLEDLDVPRAWELAEPLAVAGLDADWLERVAALAGPATGAAIAWVAATLTGRGLVDELRASTEQMSRLVAAVKTYAYMDRGDVVEADVHAGLESTLTLMAHKLKHTEIEIVRDYDRDLPPLRMRGAELNQVWTNLLDNAIDALGDHGTITVRTRREGECAIVDIADDGPGIPADIVSHVFDPFFTTKEVGRGTGLGLDTVRRIVSDRHDGSINVDSGERGTTFRVWLPLATG